MTITVKSTAFEQGSMIPSKYTCDGQDISPPLQWEGVPEDTQSIALISDDPDAPMGTWVHWVIWNIPADKTGLLENVPKDPQLADGSCQGISDFRRPGYGGPCPPGGTHRYLFKLYALDTVLDLDTGANKDELLQAMEGHILSQADLMGTYARQ